METLPRLMTADELDQFPDDGMRYEVIDGDLFMAAAPLRIHQEFSPWIYRLLYGSAEATGWGRVYYAPVDVRFSDTSQVQPDLIVIRNDRLDIYQGHIVFGPPDLVVEILSPSNRPYDEIKKARLYAANGVPEYWIGDPHLPGVRLFALRDGVYVPVEPEKNGLLHSTVVPNLTIDPEELLADLSR